MERGKRLKHQKDLGLTYREIAKNEGISRSRVFCIIREYDHRLRLIKSGHWTYGLSTRACGILHAYDLHTLNDLRAWLLKHGPNLPQRVKWVGHRLFAELTAFANNPAPRIGQ